MSNIKGGSKIWYVADGWMPLKNETKDASYEGGLRFLELLYCTRNISRHFCLFYLS